MINMELWEKDIIEWINCSQLLTEPVKNTTELQDGVFYIKFLELIKWEKYENNSNQEDLILKFLEDEYPSFKVNKDDNTEHLYVASLLLVHLSRTITAIHDLYNASNLKYNMFDVLKHETQIRVKTFLENTLPLGKEITKETIVEVIMEVEDISCTPPPVAGFSHSPATRSARSKKIMTERIRELRELKSNLAVERFTNTDLREDVKMLQEKIQKLQKKLDEKSEQLKTLRKEQIKQNTPKPSRSKEDISREDYYKKYINDLTSQLNKQQDQIDELEEENDTLAKGLSSLQRTSVHYKENFTISERSLETLSSKIELKDRELVELRIHNEELRTYIKELNKNSNVEQSFEVEDVPLSMISQRRSLNTSEALSSVIEIQLQEAKEESAILNAQVDTLKGRLDILMKDYKTAMESNRDLQEKVKMLDQLQAKLNNTQKELNILNTDITNLQSEKMSFVAQNEDLKNLLSSNEKKLSEKEQSIATLNTELDNLKLEVTDLHELLENERINCTNLNISLTETKSQVAEHLTHINKLTDERNSYRSSIENYSKNIRDIFHCDQFIQISIDNLDNLTLDDLIKHIETMLHNYNTVCTSYKCDIEKLKAAVEETNKNLLEQQLTITTLEERNKQNLEEIRDEKHILEQNLLEVISNLQSSLLNKEQLLKSLMTRLEDIQYVNKDLKLIKETTQRNFAEYQENVQLIFEKLQRNYQTLHHELHQVQQEKEELECNFNRTNSELSDIQTRNTILEENLLENQKIISALKEQEKILYNELNECKQNVLQVKETNQALEEQYAMMKTEANNNLESLKSKNAKISHELKDVTDNFNLLQTKMNDTNKQVELKQAEINRLRLDVSFLREEKKSLIYSHKEALEAKDKELGIKEEALIALQAKMDKLENKACITEKKMKEVIVNLQEVRSSQDAVLTTQEAALKEKCLHIEDLQEEFNSSKKILNKELENAKLSLRECQSNLLDVQNQINDKNKTIADQNTTLAELQEMLKKINAELETNKEHCKRTDASRAKIVKLCEKLEQPTKNLNSTIMEMCSSFDFLDQNLQDVSQYENIYIDNETADVLNIIKMTINQLHKSQKVISYLSCANAESNKTLEEQKILLENSAKDKEEICGLKNKIQELEVIAEKRNDYLKNLIKSKESLKESLQKIFASRNDLDNILISSKQKWNEILTKFQDILHIEGSVCDEFKQLQDKKTSLANALFKREIDSLENIKTISDILWKNFLWTEQKLRDTYLCSIHEKECLDVLTNAEEDQFSDEKMIIDVQLEKQKALRTDVIKSEEEMDSFTSLATWYENNLKSGKIKNQTEMEKKLQSQISQLTKEGKDLKNKIDSMRSRNVKLEKNIDDLRAEVKKLKSTETESTEVNTKEVESLKEQLEQLKQQNQLHEENLLQLHKEKDESIKIAKQKLESQLKEVHTSYERKLEDVKQKMKTAYNEQMSKFNKDQEKIVREKLQSQMEVMCQKQREELNRYKTHVSDLSSQLWTIGEKLIIEQKHHEDAVQRYRELQTKLKEIEADQGVATISRKTCTMAKQGMLPPESTQHRSQKVTTLITEETIERRHSIRNMQAMGNMFKAEDVDEIFDNVYLADMKRGNCLPSTDTDRLSILQMRNSLCKPHLKSSYPAEMQFLPPTLTEEEIKSGSLTEETFNDSLSQSLLPEQKARKKDRTQTSYKKPGPPTPSKNGGRLSLQGNELKSPSSRILRERNADRRVTTTPHSLKNIFSLKRTQDENASSTPKGRRLSSLFRKSRIQSDR
nr:PREDICTED: putative leucine-rich repeat-containing protein DDB_G0290503 [Linepithema humile]